MDWNQSQIGELAKKIDKLERNYARADYILSEVISGLQLNPKVIDGTIYKWAMRNYAEYLKDKERG
jgi:hypothetical protein